MASLSQPRALYITRIVQLLFVLGFLILISWCGTHRGWWTNINGAIAVGVIAIFFTIALSLYGIIASHLSRNPFSGGSTLRTIARIVFEIFIFLLWVAAVALMLRHKGGCDRSKGQKGTWDDKVACFPHSNDHSDTHWYEDDNPGWKWYLGAAFGIVEAISFLVTAFLVTREERGMKGSGGASFA